MATASGKYGAAVWGAGWVSGEHAKAYMANPHTEVVAIGSRTEEGAKAKAAELGLTDVAIYTDMDTMLERADIDIVSLCSPNYLRAMETIKCAEAGKHIVIEKPIAHSVEELVSMRDAVRKAKVKTVVSFVLHWIPYFKFAHEVVANGLVGKPFYVEADYLHELSGWWSGFHWAHTRQKGGSMTLLGECHAIDALRQFGGDVAEVHAYEVRGHRQDFEYAPTNVASVQFVNGAIGKVGGSFEVEMPYVFNLCLHGPNGSIRNDLWYSKKLPGMTGFMKIPSIMPDSGDVAHHPFKEEIDHFVECIREDRETVCNLEDGVKTHEVALAIDLSAAEKRTVRLPLID